MLTISAPYLLFLGTARSRSDAKTAFGLVHWAPEKCVGQYRMAEDVVSVGLSDLSFADAVAHGARTLVVGIAPVGGRIPPEWVPLLEQALESGLDIASGLHDRLAHVPRLVDAAGKRGRRLHDVRHHEGSITPGTGRKRSGKRVLMVGTDCAVGKKYAALALTDSLKRIGLDATFRATGQTGILLAGSGIAVDAVIADFLSGAAEAISPDNAPDHWDVIEGQGSLFHPAYAGVSLGLLHGSQPDAIIVCHEPGRDWIEDFPGFRTPSLAECLEANLRAARLTNPAVRAAGVSLNTSALSDEAARRCLAEAEKETGLPCSDPLRFSHDKIAVHLRDRFG